MHAGGAETMETNELLARHADAWHEATHHPFLDGIRTGALAAVALDTWLVQDHAFADALLRFQARVLARAPRTDQLPLAQGLTALAEELIWFEGVASARFLPLDAPLQPACRAYNDALDGLVTRAEPAPYAALITTVWAVERAYLDAWLGTRPGAPAFREFVERWTVDPFQAYVDALAMAADRALAAAAPEARRAAESAFLAVARHERAFWQMAFAPGH
jgi:thiaminase